jgi:hypothetical protein
MAQFYTLLTLGNTIELTHLAVGDGGGSVPTPDSDRTSLINELRRAPINRVEVDADNPNWVVVEQVMPPDVGGWTIREIGVFDAAGDLIAYGNYPETYKPTLDEGSGRTQTVRMVLQVSDTAAVTLRVDPSVVLATRKYVDDQRKAHEESREHPAATESAQGMIQRATSAQALAGSDNTRAMTPSRVHEAFKQFGVGGRAPQIAGSIDDFNRPGGAYFTVSSTPGTFPDAAPTNFGLLTVDYVTNDVHHQTWRWMTNTQTSPRVFERMGFAGGQSPAWGPWREILHTGNFSLLPAASESVAGVARVGSQAVVNQGSDDGHIVTPMKLKGWAAQWIKQATETAAGMLKVATQEQVAAGTNDETVVTPKKLRWGVSYSIGSNGYIAFPSWLGGLILQWGSFIKSAEPQVVQYPIAFPTAVYSVQVAVDQGVTGSMEVTGPAWVGTTEFKVASARYASGFVVLNAGTHWWFAIGS